MKIDNFKGLTVLVTGASSGIGEAFAKDLARRGANLVLTARSEDKLNELAKELQKNREIWVKVFCADLSQEYGARQLFDKINGGGFQIDILINNAGFGKWGNFLNEEYITYKRMISLNINALVELTYLFVPQILERNMGGIINVASTAAFQPIPYQAVYAASKSFVLNFTEALAGEFSIEGLRALALCPVYTNTNFKKVANANPDGLISSTVEQVVKAALTAYDSRRAYKIPGWTNYLNSLAPRLLTRQFAVRVVANMFRGRIKNSI